MSEDISKQLGKYIVEEIMKRPDRDIKMDEPLLSSGLVDSFSLVDLSLFIQDSYGVLIDDTELNAESFDTLEQLTALIVSRKS